MPSPQSEYAPNFSRMDDKALQKALNEYEALADSCRLTEQLKVKMMIVYVPPFRRRVWKLLSRYASGDWPQYRRSLEHYFHVGTRGIRELFNFIKCSSITHISQEKEVHQYYQEFIALSQSLVTLCWLTEDYRNVMFWCGFHPDDRVLFFPLLEVRCPFQPEELAFNYEDVFEVACIVLAGIPSPEQRVRNDEHRPPPELEHQLVRQPEPSIPDSIPIPIHPVISFPFECLATSPPSQQFNDPGERDPQPHRVDIDAGPLAGPLAVPLLADPLPPSDSLPTSSPAPLPPLTTSLLPLPGLSLAHTMSSSSLPIPLPAHPPLPPDSSPASSLSTPWPVHVPPLSDFPLTSLPLPLPAHLLLSRDLLPRPLPSPPAPPPAHSLPPSDLSPTSSPSPSPLLSVGTALLPPPPMPLPTHSPPPTDPLPTLLRPPPLPIPAHPLLPSGLLPTSSHPLPLFVHPPSSPPPPSPLHFTVPTNLCSPPPRFHIPHRRDHPTPHHWHAAQPNDNHPPQHWSSKASFKTPTSTNAVTATGNASIDLNTPWRHLRVVHMATLTAVIGTSTREDPTVAV
ncbi:hypothetical protein EDB83DRAFT_2531775 [Lactarius deliciosus]|nr:hypothetical protein EDB83DRAFT_2531775 [Lactarius deliciosus]